MQAALEAGKCKDMACPPEIEGWKKEEEVEEGVQKEYSPAIPWF